MPTLGDLKAKIAQDLRRSNLGSEIADAIPDAIRDHETERFWFNETDVVPYTLIISPGSGVAGSGLPGNTSPQGDVYLLGPQGDVQEFIKIDKVRAADPTVWYTVKDTDWTTI